MDQVSLARVSVPAPSCSRRTAAAAADGASPTTVPPSVGPRRSQGPHGGGLPGAGGGDRQLQPGPGGGHRGDERGLSGVEGDPVRGLLQQGDRDRVRGWRCARRGDRPRSTRCCSAARIAGEVNRADPATSYTLVPSRRRSSVGLDDVVLGPGDPHRPVGQDLVDEPGPPRLRPGQRAGPRRGPGVAPRRARARPATSNGRLCRVSTMVAAVTRTHAESTCALLSGVRRCGTGPR